MEAPRKLRPWKRWMSTRGCSGRFSETREKPPTHPDGSRPDPGGHPHGQFCAPCGGWQDPKAAGEENREGTGNRSPRRSHAHAVPSCPPEDPPLPSHGRASFPHAAAGFPSSAPTYTHAIGSGQARGEVRLVCTVPPP